MAINFPNSPVQGSTYDYLGVRYTYVDTGSGTGFWKVNSAGTVGVASPAEINAGVDNNKYVSPAGLEGSEYVKEAYVDAVTTALFNIMHPIGTVVLRGSDTDPNLTMLGTWASKGTGHSLQAVGVGEGAGTISGNNSATVPVPQHNHSASFSGSALGNHNHSGSFSGNTLPNHTHDVITRGYIGNASDYAHTNIGVIAAGGAYNTSGTAVNYAKSKSAGKPSGSVSVGNKSAGTPSGSVSVNNSGTSGATMDVAGAVYKVVAWERTA